MATGLTACKSCEARVAVSAKACPHCGVPNPGRAVSTLTVRRRRAWTGRGHPIRLLVDGRKLGEVEHGGVLTVEVPPGEHDLAFRGGMVGTVARLEIGDGEEALVEAGFSEWGSLGGLPVRGVRGRLVGVRAIPLPPLTRVLLVLLPILAALAAFACVVPLLKEWR